jgi:hypothetical protein
MFSSLTVVTRAFNAAGTNGRYGANVGVQVGDSHGEIVGWIHTSNNGVAPFSDPSKPLRVS